MNKIEPGTFHGGFVRNRGEGRGVRVARAKVSELPFPDPQLAQEASLSLVGATFGKTPLNARKTKLACLGISSDILDSGDPLYAKCIRQANSYKKHRAKEYFLAHGFVSSGVHAMLASAALAIAAARFIFSSAQAQSGGVLNKSDLKLASQLNDSARQNELAAWELCAREATVHKRNKMNDTSLPWVTSATAPAQPGVKRGRGRPRKVVLQTEETTDARTGLSVEQVSSSSQEGAGEGTEARAADSD